MHHPGIEAVGHGEGLEVASQGHGERQLVHEVHRRAGAHSSATQVLEAQDWGVGRWAESPHPLARVPGREDERIRHRMPCAPHLHPRLAISLPGCHC